MYTQPCKNSNEIDMEHRTWNKTSNIAAIAADMQHDVTG